MITIATDKKAAYKRSLHLCFPLCMLLCFLLSCSQEPPSPTPPIVREYIQASPSPPKPQVQFVDVSQESGILFEHTHGASAHKYFPETMGGGGMFWDYDNDGFLDIYLVNGASLTNPDTTEKPTNALYRSRGDGHFDEVGREAGVDHIGYGNGCAAGDYDNDGDLDLFLTNFGPNVLFRNRGDGSFSDRTADTGVADSSWSTSCAFFDYDLDGDLDLFVDNYVAYDLARADEATMPYLKAPKEYEGNAKGYPHPGNFEDAQNYLLSNNGDGSFSDVTRAAGLHATDSKSLGLLVADFTNDGWPDIYVANDAVRNFLFLNNADGSFREVGINSGTAYGQDGQREASMGIDAGDYNQDGRLDMVVINFQGEPNELYLNEGNGFFLPHTFPSGIGLVSLPALGFGTNFFDFDNDGLLDLFVANGHVLDNVVLFDQSTTYPQRNHLFRNAGPNQYGNYTFVEMGLKAGPDMRQEMVSRGSATGDFDNDGDSDLLVVNIGQRASLLRNDGGNKGNWLAVKTIGTESNKDGIGARLTLRVGELTQVREVRGSRSYLSQSDLRVYFGLGEHTIVDQLEIRWTSGTVEQYGDIEANQFVVLEEKNGWRRAE